MKNADLSVPPRTPAPALMSLCEFIPVFLRETITVTSESTSRTSVGTFAPRRLGTEDLIPAITVN